MLLKSLKLKNIRSYLDEQVEFPEGSLLLAGDIGAGKSTILLAIEFALFGILRGELSGSALLRNGKSAGTVELCFELAGNEISVKRSLKRAKDSVEQESGEITVNGKKVEATATELDSRVIGLLGYPKELAKKSKSLVYRYTVYTPQEEMKNILAKKPEDRLDILRKVFGIDKYKRMKENSKIYAGALREKAKEFEGYTRDLDEKLKLKSSRIEELKKIDAKIKELLPLVEKAKSSVTEKKKLVAESESAVVKFNELKRNSDVCAAELSAKKENQLKTKTEIEKLNKQIELLEKDAGKLSAGTDAKKIAEELAKKEKEFDTAEKEAVKIKELIAGLKSQKFSSEEIVKKISKLDSCPMCLQQVSVEHKTGIFGREGTKLSEIEFHIKNHLAKVAEFENQASELKKIVAELRIKERNSALIELKQRELLDKKERQSELFESAKKFELQISDIGKKSLLLASELKTFTDSAEKYKRARAELEQAAEKEKLAEIQYNSSLKEKEGIFAIVKQLDEELAKKLDAKQKLARTQQLQCWLSEDFANIVSLIETNVMARVQSEFNELFKQWFGVLVEDELMTARLDESFTPLVEQNGFEIEVDNLSGGERTACALAYRLALNKVINDLISTIKTKDLIILDEPTDGFSSQQLDKMREVLEQLDLKQIVVVSHEQKIESFVERVIRISKDGHISRIIG
jgi:exonuclease SbcC